MHSLIPLMVFVGLASIAVVRPAPAHAQAPRTWVSRVGNDANPCSTTQPCRTFAGAMLRTAVNGEINCVDAGGFDVVTITKSITIDCHDVFASILNAGGNGINILFDNFAASDTRKTVRLRNLNLNGQATGSIGINITGFTNAANSAVFIEDCLVDGMGGGPRRGISDTRAGGALSIVNTTVRNVGGTGILLTPVDNARRLEAVLDGVRVQNADVGILIARPARVVINRSLLSGHTENAIQADTGVELNLDHSTITNNGIGVRSGGAVIRLSNNDISFNRTGIGGATTSFGNNRISGNTSAGTPPTPAGAVSTDFGQQ